ncbi:hypothetical protein KCMC57_65200 (plasmid) [Kitasatospora sp. CMC57]|uniref:Peptidoglycan-binding protein n=1 Tax=Kitasatospora sp. CMC57 TaxID=3231513 RepID=A0AB33KCD3_9ACTN
MPATLLTRPTLDPDVLGPLLVAEVEAYLRTVAPPTTRLTIPAIPRHGQHHQPWHHPHPALQPTLAQRLFRRRPTPADITVTEHLTLMDRYIHHHGWTQGALWDPAGRVCVLGAHLAVLTAGYGTPTTAWRARLRIGNQLGYAGHPIPVDDWNDQPTTRQTDIHRLLQRAAAHA